MSEKQSFASRYQEVSIKTATPLQLVTMLYDGAICSLQEARGHLERRNIAARSRSINKCLAIISELHSSLNMKAGGEIANSLDRLYNYMERMIFKSNVEQSVQPLNEIEALLKNLRSAWVEIAKQSKPSAPQPVRQQMPDPGIFGRATPVATQLKSFNILI
jgi:flagellar protein FliS